MKRERIPGVVRKPAVGKSRDVAQDNFKWWMTAGAGLMVSVAVVVVALSVAKAYSGGSLPAPATENKSTDA